MEFNEKEMNVYRFTISKGDLSLIKKRGIDAYLERNRKYLFGVTSPKEDSMYFLHVETTINELEFMNEPPQQHRYIASKHLLDKLYNSIIDHGEIKNIKTKVIHFEKECFNLLGYEIKGILFFVHSPVKPFVPKLSKMPSHSFVCRWFSVFKKIYP